jgi:putative flippase GtrA
MIKKTLAYFWSLREQFIKYFVVGVSAVALDLSSLIFFKEVLGITPVIAVVLNQIFVTVFVFLLNKWWSFKAKYSHRQAIRYGIVVVFDYLFAVAAMYVFNHQLKFDYRLVRLASIALAVSWNFFLYKYWVYVKEPEIASPENLENL